MLGIDSGGSKGSIMTHLRQLFKVVVAADEDNKE